MSNALRYTLWFLGICAFQLLVFNNVNLGGLINPYIYILFILVLPFDMPPWLQLTLAFLSGLVIDMFSGTLGMHAAAATVVGFARPVVINLIAPRGMESAYNPGIYQHGIGWFTGYAAILIFIHHLFFFFLENWGLSHFGYVLLKIILSAIISTLLIILLELLFNPREKRGYK